MLDCCTKWFKVDKGQLLNKYAKSKQYKIDVYHVILIQQVTTVPRWFKEQYILLKKKLHFSNKKYVIIIK